MMTERRIVKVVHTAKDARVFLDDGSELKGLIDVGSVSTVNQLSTVKLESYVFPYKETTLFHYIHIQTGERVSLTKEQADRFFCNRDPYDWSIDYGKR